MIACLNLHAFLVVVTDPVNTTIDPAVHADFGANHSLALPNPYVNDKGMQISHDFKLIYVHIPKTGGTTIELSALFDTKRELGITPPGGHFPIRTITQRAANTTDGYLVATHIRDPCERFMSAFHYLRFYQYPSLISKSVRDNAKSFKIDESESVGQFVEWLDSTKSWESLKRRVVHFIPMAYFLFNEGGSFGADVVMCQDQWNEGIDRLVVNLKLNETPGRLLQQTRKNKARNISCNDLDMKHKMRILDEYAMDACLFGYDKYGHGEFQISGRYDDTAKCIGSQFDRKRFSNRLKFCEAKLSQSLQQTILKTEKKNVSIFRGLDWILSPFQFVKLKSGR